MYTHAHTHTHAHVIQIHICSRDEKSAGILVHLRRSHPATHQIRLEAIARPGQEPPLGRLQERSRSRGQLQTHTILCYNNVDINMICDEMMHEAGQRPGTNDVI